ncbi:MAG: hypothetical protein OXP36_11035 [Gammaproteobacteria bacterium]|nr:hypothetical protein [Gammaproteobacteria bacterium]
MLQDRALDGRVIVIRVEDGLVVKRLRRRRSAWDLVSDNPIYAPRPIGAEDRIIGRVA